MALATEQFSAQSLAAKSDRSNQLIKGLSTIPESWVLTPVKANKACYRTSWQFEAPLSHQEIIAEINSGKAKGYGLRTGTVSGGIVAIDADGHAAQDKINELSGGVPMPETVAFTSNKPGRCQYLFYIPQEYWGAISTKKIGTSVQDENNKEQKLELRWDGCQSVLPPSVHPETGYYRWVKSPEEVAIAPAPMWVIEAMLAEPESTQHEPERHATSYTRKARTGEEWSNEEWALSYLSALNPTHTDDYDSWLAVGMALHSVNDSLLIEWDDWSRQSAKYKPGCCDKKWKSFNRQGVAIGSLAHMAKQDGWRSPFEKASGRGYTGGIGSGSGGDGGNTVHQKLPIREAIAKAEQILKTQISSQLDPIEVSILLEEVRREAGVNEYNWEKNYLKPLREKLERSLALPNTVNQPIAQTDPSERLRLELLTLIKETDPIKKVRKRAEIASHYRISKGEIEFLCRTLEGDSKTPKAKFFALDDFLSIESEGIDYLIPGLLPRGETVLCSGLPKSGKTLLAIDAAFAIATGESHFLGEAVQQGKVLLVSVDESAQSTKAKLIKRGFRPRDTASIAVMTTWDISQLDALEAKLEVFRPDVVVIDSLKRITAGREISENSAEFADIIYTLKELLTQYSAAGILIHHSNKNPEATGVSRVRGSTAIAGAVWGIWQMDIPESEDESDGKPSKGKPKQKRFDPTNPNRVFTAICRDTEGALLNIKFNPENHSYVISDGDATAQSERKTQEQVILDILAQVAPKGLTGREIMEYSGLGRGIYSVLNRMVDKRIITQRQSSTDARMTVYCLPKKQGTHTPPHSDLLCDQYSLNSPTGMDLEIDHKLITTPEELITNFCKNDQKNRDAINSNPEPAPPPVEIDHKNTDRGGVCECAEYVEVDDPWIDEKPADVLLQLAQPEAIASKPQEVWAWNRETGECLGQVLYDGDNRLKIRRTGEPASRAKWHERNQITFKNPTVSALSLNTSATTPVEWEDSEQFLEEFED